VQNAESVSFQGFPPTNGGKLKENVENAKPGAAKRCIFEVAKIKLLTVSTKRRWKTQKAGI